MSLPADLWSEYYEDKEVLIERLRYGEWADLHDWWKQLLLDSPYKNHADGELVNELRKIPPPEEHKDYVITDWTNPMLTEI